MSFEEPDTTEEHEKRITRCKSCRAMIIWLKTQQGRNIPVDADTVKPEDQIYDRNSHQTHFETCPNADHHRKPAAAALQASELNRLKCALAHAGMAADELVKGLTAALGTKDWERVLQENGGRPRNRRLL